jgi:hypothetical protein
VSPARGDRPRTTVGTVARIPQDRRSSPPQAPPGGSASPRPTSRTSLLSENPLRARGRVAPAPPPQAEKGYRPRAPKARSPTGGDCPRNPRRASPSRPTGGPLPCHESKNSGRSIPKPTTKASTPAVLTPTGRFAALSGGQSPPAPENLSLKLPFARWHRRPRGRGPDFCL